MAQFGKVVPMADVPESEHRVGKYAKMYYEIAAIKAGEAYMVEFASLAVALSARACLRKFAKKHNRFLSSSRANGGKTRYFWLEPKETK